MSETIDFNSTRVLANIEHRIRGIIIEAVQIDKRPNKLNVRDDTQRL